MNTPSLLLSIILLSAVPSTDETTQQVNPTLASQQAANATLNAAIEASGGFERLSAIPAVRLEARVDRRMLGQSLRADEEDAAPRTQIYATTLEFERGLAPSSAGWAGDIIMSPGAEAAVARLVDTEEARFLHYVAQNSARHLWPGEDLSDLQLVLSFAPAHLLAARRRAATLRMLTPRESQTSPSAITFADSSGTQISLYFDAKTHLLSRRDELLSEPHDQLGDVVISTTFGDYRAEEGVLLPREITVSIHGVEASQVEILSHAKDVAYSFDARFDRALLAWPAEASLAFGSAPEGEAAVQRVEELAPGLFQILNVTPGYNALFVVQDSKVYAIEAPGSPPQTEELMALMRATAPEAEIEALVITHHHYDHTAGLIAHLAAGHRIITTPGNEDFVGRVAAAPRTTAGGSRVPTPRLEFVEGRRMIGSGATRFELIDVGPNPHAEEILVVYFPEQRLMWVPDIYGYMPGFTPPPLLLAFAERLKELDLAVDRFATAHTELSTLEEFEAMVEKAK